MGYPKPLTLPNLLLSYLEDKPLGVWSFLLLD